MKTFFLIVFIVGFCSCFCHKVNSQPIGTSLPDITGIWRGYIREPMTCGCFCGGNMTSNDAQELHFDKFLMGGYKGLAYTDHPEKPPVSHLEILFDNDVLVIKEKQMVNGPKPAGDKLVCQTTYRLKYTVKNNVQRLAGTYKSVDKYTGHVCGSGSITFSPRSETGFLFAYKELPNTVSNVNSILSFSRSNYNLGQFNLQLKPGKKPATVKKITPNSQVIAVIKPVEKVVQQTAKPLGVTRQIATGVVTVKKAMPSAATLPQPVYSSLVLPDRANRQVELIKTLKTTSPSIKIWLYDNGQIDGDTISVYHNNRLIISKQRLSVIPINFTIVPGKGQRVHEIIMVAENMGYIPPNTSLMIIEEGGNRHEVSISTTETKDARIVFVFDPA